MLVHVHASKHDLVIGSQCMFSLLGTYGEVPTYGGGSAWCRKEYGYGGGLLEGMSEAGKDRTGCGSRGKASRTQYTVQL